MSLQRLEVDAEYRGIPAVAVVQEGSAESEEPEGTETVEFTVSQYVDRDTFLPLAWVYEFHTVDDDQDMEGPIVLSFDNEFLPADSLPADLFDPASIGYVEVKPSDGLDEPDLGVTVYWLGETFPGEGGLPPLTLVESKGPREPGGGPGERVEMRYKIEEDGAPRVTLQLWEPGEWRAFLTTQLGRLVWDSACAERQETEVDGGHAVIFKSHEPKWPPPTQESDPTPVRAPSARDVTPTQIATATPGECPSRPYDRFVAHVYFDDTVVAVNAPIGLNAGRYGTPDPYDSLEGMEAIVRGLRVRQPGE